jgi:sulfite reductase alpha subunit-like flavoprotein
MRPTKTIAVTILSAMICSASASAGEMTDSRQLVELPKNIESKMLINMRDHIAALDDIIAAVHVDKYDKAADIAESRLGWSSLVRRGDQDVTKHWAAPMQKMADSMYRAASNFVIVAQDASVEETKESYKKVIGSIQKITTACRGCHGVFRVR